MSLQITEIISAANTFIPSAAFDEVAVYDQNFNQVFSNARPMHASIRDEAKVMEHPVETGATISDHIVFQPVEIDLSMILKSSNYRDTYQNIRQLYKAATVLIVQTKAGTYFNQLIQSIPHEEDPEIYDTIALSLRLKEVLFVTSISQALPTPKYPANSSTVSRGTVQPTNTTVKNTSVAHNIFF